MELENRVAVVTGGARGLGRAVSKALAQARCRVAVADIDEDGAAETARLIGKPEERPSHSAQT